MLNPETPKFISKIENPTGAKPQIPLEEPIRRENPGEMPAPRIPVPTPVPERVPTPIGPVITPRVPVPAGR